MSETRPKLRYRDIGVGHAPAVSKALSSGVPKRWFTVQADASADTVWVLTCRYDHTVTALASHGYVIDPGIERIRGGAVRLRVVGRYAADRSVPRSAGLPQVHRPRGVGRF